MAALMVLLAVMMIMSTLVFQGWQDVKHRDDEAEMICRAQEIVRAIVRYRKDRGAGPTALEQLIEPGPRAQFYLRQLYEDPLVEDGQWGLLYVGPNNEILDPGAATPGGGLLGGINPSELVATNRERLNAHIQRRKDRAAERGIDPRRIALGGRRQPAQVAGLPIAGVKSLATGQAFRVYKGQTEYSEWLFTYLDLEIPQIPGQKAGGRNRLPGGTASQGRSISNSGSNSNSKSNRRKRSKR